MTTHQRSPMRYAAHKVCAYPYWISWMIGTLALWVLLTWNLFSSVSFAAVFEQWTAIPLVILSYVATAGFGIFVGVTVVSWVVLPRCRRFNGAPYKPEERVLILAGPHAGSEALIITIEPGQGGDPVLDAFVDTPPENLPRNKPRRVLLDDYSVLRLNHEGKSDRPRPPHLAS